MRRCFSVTALCACLVIPQAVVTQVGGVAPTLMNESAVPSLPDGGAATGYAVRDAATRTRAFGVLRFFGGGALWDGMGCVVDAEWGVPMLVWPLGLAPARSSAYSPHLLSPPPLPTYSPPTTLPIYS